MPNDTKNPFDRAAEQAAAETDQELAEEEEKIKTISWDELKKKLPSPVDQKNLDELIEIVNGATEHNEKVASLISNIQELAGVVVKVLSRIPQ